MLWSSTGYQQVAECAALDLQSHSFLSLFCPLYCVEQGCNMLKMELQIHTTIIVTVFYIQFSSSLVEKSYVKCFRSI
jgi:hypothetical protein